MLFTLPCNGIDINRTCIQKLPVLCLTLSSSIEEKREEVGQSPTFMTNAPIPSVRRVA